MENEKKKKSFKMKDADKNEILTMKNLGEIKSVLLDIMEKNKTETLQNYGLDEIEFYDPRKEKIDDSGIKIKYAGFNLIYNEEAREKINKFLKEKIGINDGIKGIDIEKFKITKAEYKEAKKDFNNKLKEFSKFIQICCDCLKVENNSKLVLTFKLEEFNTKLKENKFNECKNENLIETNIETIISSFKSEIKQLRDILSKRTDAQVKHYRNFAENLEKCIEMIDNKIKYNKINNKTDELKQALKFVKSGMELEHEYLLTKDKRDKENNPLSTKFINPNPKYKELKQHFGISDYFAESEFKNGKYEKISGKDPNDTMTKIFGEDQRNFFAKIFGDSKNRKWEPDIDDIKQGYIGDCYLLSALQILCQTPKGRENIKKCFVNFEDIYEDNYTKFQFYKLKFNFENFKDKISFTAKAKKNEKTTIIVDNTVLHKILSDKNGHVGNQSGKLWVNLFEKAFAIYRKDETNFDMTSCAQEMYSKQFPSKDPVFVRAVADIVEGTKNLIKPHVEIKEGLPKGFSQANLDGGRAFIPLAAITGNATLDYSKSGHSGKLEEGYSIGFIKLPEYLSKYGLFNNHAYSVLSRDNNDNSIEIKNPHNKLPYYDFSVICDESNKPLKLNKIPNKDITHKIEKKGKNGIIRLKHEQITDVLDPYISISKL